MGLQIYYIIIFFSFILSNQTSNLRVQLIFFAPMSFFFNKSENKDNLQYDDTASLHFAISICVVTALTFLGFIYRDILNRKDKNLAKAYKVDSLKDKIKNSQKKKKNYFLTTDFLYKFAIIAGCILFGIYCFSNISQNSKMIGFDPYEILGVESNAPVTAIKKAYRKLALQYHPDRNANDPTAAAKFILISKAYQCLTDEQAKQKCQKYGNPDGQASFKVGIGLPRFMVEVQNQYFFLFPIFAILLFVVPRSFIKWSNRIKPKDENGNLLANYEYFYTFITPAMNPITFSLILGCMKELDAIFPEKKTLEPEMQNGFKNLILSCRALSPEQLQKIPSHILYRCCSIYSYMANRSKKQGLSELIPDLCRKIIKFTLYYTQKTNDKRLMYNNPNWVINYYGIYPTKLALFFSKQMFNPSIRIGDTRSIQFLDLTPQEQLMAKNIPIGNLQQNLLWSDEAINNLVLNFSQDRQKYIKQQVQSLPALKVQTRVLLGSQQVRQMTIDDFAELEIKIIRKKQTPGYVLCKDFPHLAKQQFLLIVSYNSNLMFLSSIVFKEGENQVIFKCPHRQNVEKAMKFDVSVISACYPNTMDIQTDFYLNVINRIQNRPVQIHKDDQNLERIPKNFFESLASMDALNESDRQLSQGSDDEQEMAEKQTRTGGFKQEEPEHDHENCDHDHEEEHSHRHEHHCADC